MSQLPQVPAHLKRILSKKVIIQPESARAAFRAVATEAKGPRLLGMTLREDRSKRS